MLLKVKFWTRLPCSHWVAGRRSRSRRRRIYMVNNKKLLTCPDPRLNRPRYHSVCRSVTVSVEDVTVTVTGYCVCRRCHSVCRSVTVSVEDVTMKSHWVTVAVREGPHPQNPTDNGPRFRTTVFITLQIFTSDTTKPEERSTARYVSFHEDIVIICQGCMCMRHIFQGTNCVQGSPSRHHDLKLRAAASSKKRKLIHFKYRIYVLDLLYHFIQFSWLCNAPIGFRVAFIYIFVWLLFAWACSQGTVVRQQDLLSAYLHASFHVGPECSGN